MNRDELLDLVHEGRNHLSILKYADEHCITYYTGDDPLEVEHLKQCTLLCHHELNVNLVGSNVDIVRVGDPQLAFYQLSAEFKVNYLDYDAMSEINGSHIHRMATVPESCSIGPGCIIGDCVLAEDVRLDPNCVVYSYTEIGAHTVVEANSVLGATGVMWVWNGHERVFLKQLGGVQIGKDCFIGSNVTIVRGNANERTVVGAGTCIAHGTMIGHGCQIGESNHFANNVALGGSVISGEGCFFGSGSIVSPGTELCSETVIGAGAMLSKNTEKPGIYVGIPARRVSDIKENMAGIPMWKR